MPAISAELCVAGRELTEPRLSPDGRWLSAVEAGRPGSIQVVAIERRGAELVFGPERSLSTLPAPVAGRGLGGGCHHWLADSSGVVYAAVDGAIWYQPLGSAAPERLVALAGIALRAPMIVEDGHGSWCVVAVGDDAAVWSVVARRGGTAWESEPAVRIDDGSDDFCLDPWVRAVGPGGFEIRWHAWSVPDMAWDRSVTRIAELHHTTVTERRTIAGSGAITQPRTLSDGTPIAVRDDTGWLNVWVGASPVIDEPFEHAGPTWGAGLRSYALAPDDGRLAVARNEAGYGRLIVADLGPGGAGHGDVVEVARGVHGQLDWQAGLLCAVRSGARTPTQIVVYDTGSEPWARTMVLCGLPVAWDSVELPEPEVVQTSDPVLHARVYRAGTGKVICLIHGGPTDQWQVSFMPRVAFWWSRGWDVLVVDPRGSTGHGRAYQQALRGRWGDRDVSDTAVLIGHAHSLGWATPQTTVAAGSSSGGLSAIGLAARFGSLLAGVMASAPVTDLAGLADVDHRFEAHYTLSLVGPPGARGYRENSPANQLDQIDVPLMIVHGDADPVVPVDQSRRTVAALRSRGIEVDYHEFAGEGHGLRDRANRLAEFEHMERFAHRVVSSPWPS